MQIHSAKNIKLLLYTILRNPQKSRWLLNLLKNSMAKKIPSPHPLRSDCKICTTRVAQNPSIRSKKLHLHRLEMAAKQCMPQNWEMMFQHVQMTSKPQGNYTGLPGIRLQLQKPCLGSRKSNGTPKIRSGRDESMTAPPKMKWERLVDTYKTSERLKWKTKRNKHTQ